VTGSLLTAAVQSSSDFDPRMIPLRGPSGRQFTVCKCRRATRRGGLAQQKLAPNRLRLGARKLQSSFALGRERTQRSGVTVGANGGLVPNRLSRVATHSEARIALQSSRGLGDYILGLGTASLCDRSLNVGRMPRADLCPLVARYRRYRSAFSRPRSQAGVNSPRPVLRSACSPSPGRWRSFRAFVSADSP
jgi:hypothetical protein